MAVFAAGMEDHNPEWGPSAGCWILGLSTFVTDPLRSSDVSAAANSNEGYVPPRVIFEDGHSRAAVSGRTVTMAGWRLTEPYKNANNRLHSITPLSTSSDSPTIPAFMKYLSILLGAAAVASAFAGPEVESGTEIESVTEVESGLEARSPPGNNPDNIMMFLCNDIPGPSTAYPTFPPKHPH